MVIWTVVDAMQLEPDPNAPEHVVTPDDKLVIAPDPRVPPLPTVVCPDKCGNAAIPLEGVTADGVASPIVTASVREKADPAVVIALSVCIRAGTPSVREPTFSPPMALEVVDPPDVTDGVIFDPLRLYVVPNFWVVTNGISIEIWADVTNFCVMSA